MSSETYTITVSPANCITLTYSGGAIKYWSPENVTVTDRSNVYFRIGDSSVSAFLDWTKCTSPTGGSKTAFLANLNALIQSA